MMTGLPSERSREPFQTEPVLRVVKGVSDDTYHCIDRRDPRYASPSLRTFNLAFDNLAGRQIARCARYHCTIFNSA